MKLAPYDSQYKDRIDHMTDADLEEIRRRLAEDSRFPLKDLAEELGLTLDD